MGDKVSIRLRDKVDFHVTVRVLDWAGLVLGCLQSSDALEALPDLRRGDGKPRASLARSALQTCAQPQSKRVATYLARQSLAHDSSLTAENIHCTSRTSPRVESVWPPSCSALILLCGGAAILPGHHRSLGSIRQRRDYLQGGGGQDQVQRVTPPASHHNYAYSIIPLTRFQGQYHNVSVLCNTY